MIGLATLFLFTKIQAITEVKDHSNRLEILILNSFNLDHDYFENEITNERYFSTRESTYLRKRDSISALLHSEFDSLGILYASTSSEGARRLVKLDSIYRAYNFAFYQLESLIHKRGFKDYGMEGQMRSHAHQLEDSYEKDRKANILMLRRLEKDFLLRHDTFYAANFISTIKNEIAELQIDSSKNSRLLFHLRMYYNEFVQRVALEREIGLTSNDGLRGELNTLKKVVSEEFIQVAISIDQKYTAIIRSAVIIYVLAIVTSIGLSLAISLWISKKLSEPIVKLAKWVDSSTSGRKGVISGKQNSRNSYEINMLKQAFINLVKRTRKQMNEIKEKSNLLDRNNQELMKLNHELDNFLYSTAHDLRSPLASLSGLTTLMKRENKQSELEVYLNMMQINVKRQEDFIAQIVNYAKNSKLEILPEEIDLKILLLEIFQNHEFIEGAASIQKYIQIDSSIPFYSDRNRITIIFNNLVSNAIRYSDKSKGENRFIEIKIDVKPEEALITFTDNGIGIDEIYLDKIFNMFYRANVHSKGSGLGLFILREAAIKLNGEVRVESKINEGTSFEIRIPNLLQNHSLYFSAPLHHTHATIAL